MATPRVTDPPTVTIDGVLYVPVSEAHISARAIEDAIISQYMGDDWRRDYPGSAASLRVITTDDPGWRDEGETVTQFVARLLAAASREPG